MSTQQCPQCKKIVSLEDSFCRARGAKLPPQNADAQPAAARPKQSPKPEQQPAVSPSSPATSSAGDPVWRKHVDAWNGFSLERPSGWEVRVTHDTITVCQDLQGLTCAMIRPIQLLQSVSADELARRLVEAMRASSSDFAAWQMAPGERTYIAMHRGPDQVLLRIRLTQEKQALVGVLSVMVDGDTALVSGFQAPVPVIEKMKPVFQHMLASFDSIARLPRTRFVEQSEQAFAALIPEQWQATGKVLRTPDAGVVFRFRATDAAGTLSAEVPGRYYFFQEEAKGWLGKLVIPQKYPTRPFVPATTFLEKMIVPEMRQLYADLHVEKIVNRADLAASLVANALQFGEWVQPKQLMAAALQCTFTENGVKYRQRTYIAVQRWPLTRVWRVAVGSVVRTPQDQFAQHCATLEGITESVRPEMDWVQLQRQKAQQAALQSMQQIAGALQAMQGQRVQPQAPMQQPWLPGAGMSMPGYGMPQGGQGQGASVQEQMAMQQAWQQAQLKQLEIMRNSNQQIFDMQQAGMQRQMASQEQQFQGFDQVIRGYQDMRNPYSGAQYEVPIGYNNYWANGLDQVVGSNLSDAPGFGFQRLD